MSSGAKMVNRATKKNYRPINKKIPDSVALDLQPGVWIAPILLSLLRAQSASQVQAHVFLPPLEGFNPDRISILELQEHYKCRLSREQSRGYK